MTSDSPTSPVIAGRRLRALLRTAREINVTTQAEAARQLGWSMSKLQRIENGNVSVSAADVATLAGLYRVGPEIEARLASLAAAAAGRGWWTDLVRKREIGVNFGTFVGLEFGATSISFYQIVLVPGLFQTPRYTAHVLDDAMQAFSQQPTKAAAAIRQARQEDILNRAFPPRIFALFDESMIHRRIGDHETMHEQLRWLIELTRRPAIEIRIRPHAAGPPSYFYPFVLLGFDHDPEVLYLENHMSDTLIENAELVGHARAAFETMWAEALTSAKTRTLLRRVADGYTTGAGSGGSIQDV